MKTINENEAKNIKLFHITSRDNLESISKYGLKLPSNLTDLIQFRFDFVSYDNSNYTLNNAKNDVKPFIFAVKDYNDLSLLDSLEDPIILGIVNCDQFWQEDFCSFGEYITDKPVFSNNLVLIKRND